MLRHRSRRRAARTGVFQMKTILAAAAYSAIMAGSAAATTTPSAGPAPTAPAVGSVFTDLAGFGYDLGKFRPDYAGRFPYRQ
jgi:hypothetical protein